VPQRSSSTSPGQDRLRVVPSGLNEPRFPVFSRRNAKRDLAHPENREIAGVLERGAGRGDPDNPLNTVTDADRAEVVLAFIAENPKLLDRVRQQLQ